MMMFALSCFSLEIDTFDLIKSQSKKIQITPQQYNSTKENDMAKKNFLDSLIKKHIIIFQYP